jgi:hypothetical protein
MHTLFHIILIFCCIILYFHILKHIDYIDTEDIHNSFFIEYQNNRELQQLCDKDKILIFDSPCNIEYNGIIHLSNSDDDEVVEVPYDAFIKLMYCDKDSYYFSNTTPIYSEHKELSKLLHLPFSLNNRCVLLGGQRGYNTPDLVHSFHRKFLFVSKGSIQVLLQPLTQEHNIHTDIKQLHHSVDNVDTSKYEIIELNSGQIVFIPHNYIYKIMYCEAVNIVYDLTSHSISSLCVNLKDIILHKIQTRNVCIKDVDIDTEIDETSPSQSDIEPIKDDLVVLDNDNNNEVSQDIQ